MKLIIWLIIGIIQIINSSLIQNKYNNNESIFNHIAFLPRQLQSQQQKGINYEQQQYKEKENEKQRENKKFSDKKVLILLLSCFGIFIFAFIIFCIYQRIKDWQKERRHKKAKQQIQNQPQPQPQHQPQPIPQPNNDNNVRQNSQQQQNREPVVQRPIQVGRKARKEGLSIGIIEKIMPKIKFKDINHILGDTISNDCVICLVEMDNCEEVRMTQCFHVFHSNCMLGWFKNKVTCPYCRQDHHIQYLKQMEKTDRYHKICLEVYKNMKILDKSIIVAQNPENLIRFYKFLYHKAKKQHRLEQDIQKKKDELFQIEKAQKQKKQNQIVNQKQKDKVQSHQQDHINNKNIIKTDNSILQTNMNLIDNNNSQNSYMFENSQNNLNNNNQKEEVQKVQTNNFLDISFSDQNTKPKIQIPVKNIQQTQIHIACQLLAEECEETLIVKNSQIYRSILGNQNLNKSNKNISVKLKEDQVNSLKEQDEYLNNYINNNNKNNDNDDNYIFKEVISQRNNNINGKNQQIYTNQKNIILNKILQEQQINYSFEQQQQNERHFEVNQIGQLQQLNDSLQNQQLNPENQQQQQLDNLFQQQYQQQGQNRIQNNNINNDKVQCTHQLENLSEEEEEEKKQEQKQQENYSIKEQILIDKLAESQKKNKELEKQLHLLTIPVKNSNQTLMNSFDRQNISEYEEDFEESYQEQELQQQQQNQNSNNILNSQIIV